MKKHQKLRNSGYIPFFVVEHERSKHRSSYAARPGDQEASRLVDRRGYRDPPGLDTGEPDRRAAVTTQRIESVHGINDVTDRNVTVALKSQGPIVRRLENVLTPHPFVLDELQKQVLAQRDEQDPEYQY